MAELPKNRFKAAIVANRLQRGLWCALADPLAAELCAGAGFDWMLFDTEHAPTNSTTVLPLLQAAAPYPVSTLVRVTSLDPAEIKKVLDLGVQTILVPYIQNATEARLAAASVAYPPDGIRGVAASSRATQFGRIKGYHRKAREQICLIVQVETAAAIDEIEAIAATPGIDGVFIGPADLAASLGYPGEPGQPAVKKAVIDAIGRIRAAGLPAGILTMDPDLMAQAIEAGAVFHCSDMDVVALRNGLAGQG